MDEIPISAAKRIADDFGMDQVIVIARTVGKGGKEYVVTYGRDRIHCSIAARVGTFLKHRIMGWPEA